MSSPDTVALALSDRVALGPAEAFIDGHEFCHLLPLPEGGIHLTLPAPFRELVVDLGWAEPHPLARSGIMPALLTVYAPRNHQELDTVASLVSSSCLHAKGRFFGWRETSVQLYAFSTQLSEHCSRRADTKLIADT